MWGAMIRLGARYAFFRRWKNTIALCGAALLCATTAVFVDAKMDLTAGIVGILAAVALIALAIHYIRERHETRERERRQLGLAARRAATAEARNEKIEKVKTSAAEMAKGVSTGAAGLMGAAKAGFSDARDRVSSWRNKDGTS